MDANELRLGNYVIGISNTPEVIELISKDEVDTDLHDCLKITLADPIPLTEEWLLKLGFVRNSNTGISYTLDSYPQIDFYSDSIEIITHCEDGENPIIIEHIKHVHQLQNLYFALTGKELIKK